VTSPNPVEVVLTVLGRTGNGVPAQSVLDEVANAVTAKMVRPLTDEVTVQGAQILNYTVAATLEFYDGPDREVVKQAAIDAVAKYTAARHSLGDAATDSGLKAALHQPGVKKVTLTSPGADVSAQGHQAPYCTGITVEAA
jgi:phage-related baseplate assembly protein